MDNQILMPKGGDDYPPTGTSFQNGSTPKSPASPTWRGCVGLRATFAQDAKISLIPTGLAAAV